MMKKFILFTILFILTGITSYAEQPGNLDKQKEILVNLEIVSADNINNKFSNDMFIEGLENIVTDKAGMSPEMFARSRGLIGENEKYNGSGSVTFEKAVRYMIYALDYNDLYSNESQYLDAARTAGLLDGVEYIAQKTLTNSDGIKILMNFTEAKPLLTDIGNYDRKISDKPALEEFRKIYKIRGVVTAASKTSILGDREVGKNKIEIEEVQYDCAFGSDDLLGLNVEGYIHIDQGNEEILYLEKRENKNKEITIMDEDIIDVDINLKKISYDSYDTMTKSLRLNDNIRVIYNGRFYGEYTAADFKPKNGNIRLVDNNNDGTYDVAFISDLKTVVVESVFTDDLKIYDKLNLDSSVSIIKLEEDEYEIYIDGKESKLSDIDRDDVLSVAISHGGSPYITIYVNSDKITGSIESFNENEKEIYISGEKYKILQDALDSLHANNKDIKIKSDAVAYLDINGRIAYIDVKSTQKYFLFLKTYISDAEDKYMIKCLDMNGTWRDIEYNAKTKINDERSNSIEALYDTFSGFQPQVVRMNVNFKGIITNIETARTFDGSSDKYFTKTTFTSQYEPIYGAFANFYRIEDEDSALFVFPKNEKDKYNREKYRVEVPSTYFYNEHGTYSDVTVYDVDEFRYGHIFSVVDDESANIGHAMFIVTGTGTVLDKNDEVVKTVEVSISGRDPIDLQVKYGVNVDVKKGDIVRFAINEDGQIAGYEKICSAFDKNLYVGSVSSGYGKIYGVGVVDKLENDRVNFKFETAMPTGINGYEDVRIYYTDSNTSEVCSIRDMQVNDRVVCRIVAARLYNVIIIR